MRKPFCPGQLVKLNAFAIECIEPRNGGFKVMTAEGYDSGQYWKPGFIKTIPIDSPCLVIGVYPEDSDSLLVLFEEALIRISHEYMEQF